MNGGAIYIIETKTININNNTLSDNLAKVSAGSLFIELSADIIVNKLEIYNSISEK